MKNSQMKTAWTKNLMHFVFETLHVLILLPFSKNENHFIRFITRQKFLKIDVTSNFLLLICDLSAYQNLDFHFSSPNWLIFMVDLPTEALEYTVNIYRYNKHAISIKINYRSFELCFQTRTDSYFFKVFHILLLFWPNFSDKKVGG